MRASISALSNPQSLKTSRLSAPGLGGADRMRPGVRDRRGAGAGRTTPNASVNVPRAARCAPSGASARSRTGATHPSTPSNAAAHSSRVRVRKARAQHRPHSRPCPPGPAAQELRIVYPEDSRRSRRRIAARARRRRCSGRPCTVGAVEGRPAVQQVRAALVAPQPAGVMAVDHRHQEDAPSTMAESITCPRPLRCRSSSAARIPTTRNIVPPPKSATRLSGGTGARRTGRCSPARR